MRQSIPVAAGRQRVMTIIEAEQKGECLDCIFRLAGASPHRCMGTRLGETECPGRCGQDTQHQKEKEQDV